VAVSTPDVDDGRCKAIDCYNRMEERQQLRCRTVGCRHCCC